MKTMDLLKKLDMVDPSYVEEASDRNLLLYRRRQRRTRLAVAACLAAAVLTGAFAVKPMLHAWERRNTVTSWEHTLQDSGSKPSSPIYVSAKMPVKRRLNAATAFTVSVGLGQSSSYKYATLSIKAPGFEITDGDGNTVTDRYVRTLSDFNGGNFEVLRADSKDRGRITGCEYFEDFTFRYVGKEDSVEQGNIDFCLHSRDGSSLMGDSVTVYYTLENGVLRLTDKRLADVNGSDGAVLYPEDETEPGTVTLSKEDIAVRADMATALLTPGLDMKGSVEITARFLPRGKDYPTDHFTAELIYAETLRERNYSFFIKKPIEQTEHGQWIALVPRVPTDAPLGSYDLRITDTDTGFEWVFANMALVVPPEDHPEGEKYPSRESFICEAEAAKPTLSQGEYFDGTVAPVFSVTLISKDGKDVSSLCQAELIYAEDAAKTYGFTVKSSALMSTMPPPYVPVDAPVGMYDLVVTDSVQGHMWRFEDFIEIIEAPDSELMRYSFSYHTETPTVSRSAGHTYYLFAFVENRGGAMNVGEGEYFAPAASMVMQTSNSGFIPVIKLKASPTQNPGPYAYDILRGQKGQMRYELEITPDTHCGVYDLVLSYGDCSKYFLGVIKVVP